MLKLLGVAGWPVGHSRSPAMHSAALAELGLDWRYLKLPVAPDRFAEVVAALPEAGYVGLNVTVPHKEAALLLADRATATATAVGAANTLTFTDTGIEAENTDAPGLIAALSRPVEGRSALVLGAGGAGRAAAWALREAGAQVSVWNRTHERARDLAASLGVGLASHPTDADLLVNTTAVGLGGETSERETLEALDLGGVKPPEVLVDLVYGDRPTALVRWGRDNGAEVVDGLEVLVRQGALSLERWTGRPAPVEVMRRAARR